MVRTLRIFTATDAQGVLYQEVICRGLPQPVCLSSALARTDESLSEHLVPVTQPGIRDGNQAAAIWWRRAAIVTPGSAFGAYEGDF